MEEGPEVFESGIGVVFAVLIVIFFVVGVIGGAILGW